MERFHKRLKGECLRVMARTDLEEARHLVVGHVEEYNSRRLHSPLPRGGRVRHLEERELALAFTTSSMAPSIR